ncbi:uncharacterized protein LOC121925144 [Sceloporus undulatus]|uniref:uncharacterized protein LOC121925144 n=1 Tax=Sceloporus undulatus TaxID=8520 RepID=UPI001C4B9347|nr:uncharacterized protein LOC121925144 [Sceloporus undulatus]XP_042312893.1 uncharacterized protein LOC121925144 [Sceloporus undulatus]
MMAALDTKAKAKKTLGTVDYVESSEFAQGILPTKKDVIQNMLYLLHPKRAGQAQRSKEDAAQLLAELLQEHWLFCNLYTIATQSIKKHILKVYEEFSKLYQSRKRRKNELFTQKADDFNRSSEQLFDIFCTDTVTREKLEQYSGMKMTDTEWKFLEDQRSERKMYFEDFMDKKQMETIDRRRKVESLEHFRKIAEEEREACKRKEMTSNRDEQSVEDVNDRSTDDSCIEHNKGIGGFSHKAKRKRLSSGWITGTATSTSFSESVPPECQHIRMSIRKVRPGFYETFDKYENC